MPDRYDFCVVGAGSAGFSAAQTARELGKSVVLVDGPGELSGLCILRGCMPAKTVLESAEVAHEVQTAREFGVDAKGVKIDTRAIVGRKRELVDEFKEDRLNDLRTFPIVRGRVRFRSRTELDVDGRTITASKFLVSTGSIIDPPPFPGLRETPYMTSTEALELTHVPQSLIMLGGGPVGCEFAQYFARLGAQVTLVQDSPTLLVKEDPDIGEALREGFAEEGIRVITSARIERITKRAQIEVALQVSSESMTIGAQALFLAMGRQPNVAGLGLAAAGIKADQTGIRVNHYLQTTNPDVFAAGDVIGRRALVHVARQCGERAARNAFGEPRAFDFDLYECRSVSTHPEIAVAGINETDARRRGLKYEVASYPFSDHGRAITANVPEGFVKMLAAPDGKILGVAFVGAQASDMIHEATTLLHFGAGVRDVVETPHLHPTMGEIITYPAEELCKGLNL